MSAQTMIIDLWAPMPHDFNLYYLTVLQTRRYKYWKPSFTNSIHFEKKVKDIQDSGVEINFIDNTLGYLIYEFGKGNAIVWGNFNKFSNKPLQIPPHSFKVQRFTHINYNFNKKWTHISIFITALRDTFMRIYSEYWTHLMKWK